MSKCLQNANNNNFNIECLEFRNYITNNENFIKHDRQWGQEGILK